MGRGTFIHLSLVRRAIDSANNIEQLTLRIPACWLQRFNLPGFLVFRSLLMKSNFDITSELPKRGDSTDGAKGAVGRCGFVELIGRAHASSTVEIRSQRGDGEFVILGTTTALPLTDPFVQPVATPDASNRFAFRAGIQPGTYSFEVRLQGSSLDVASSLSLTDLVSAKKYSFEEGSGGAGRFVTHDVTVTAAA
ncbi:hypothetical protein SAMN05216337_104046 [Bradyrhizobium brasilense]|uniref:Uncharacterized protein n=1 Tax=Bradyrhizobium brasilense TaxID=1419277 RepID=A0A1G7H4V9_9BRAD|nr:hypothetical protein [Bradyrhizobium brasilense]SDE95487.1 hypothetical protein SAMN05216337_104046 [Bradyrhizobium brasilense]